jgi:diacylglycerol kinase (ATP)
VIHLARRCFIIINPTSGSYSQSLVESVTHTLTKNGLEPVLLPTRNAMDATLFASRICVDNPDPLILVAGGDGTVNGVLNGLQPGVATLGVIPIGTSNVLARELKIYSVTEAVKRVARGESRSIPIGEMECSGQKKRFLLMAGVGVDGAVVRGVRLAEKRRFGKGAYFLSALRVARSWERENLEVRVDGKSVSCHSVIICNAGKYGGNFVLSPHGDLFTPGFQVVCITGGPFSYLKLFMRLAVGRVAGSSALSILPGNEVEVAGWKDVQLDGDYCGCAPLRLKSIPDFVRVIV